MVLGIEPRVILPLSYIPNPSFKKTLRHGLAGLELSDPLLSVSFNVENIVVHNCVQVNFFFILVIIFCH